MSSETCDSDSIRERDPDVPAALLRNVHRLLRCSHVLSSTVHDILEEKFISAIGGQPLTRSQFRLLKVVTLDGDSQVGEIAGFMGVSAAATSKHLNTLERLELVSRTSSPHDRRATLLKASTEGRRLVHAFERLTAARLSRVVAAVGAARVEELCDLLEALCLELLLREHDGEGSCLRCSGYFADDCPFEDIHGGCPPLADAVLGPRGGS